MINVLQTPSKLPMLQIEPRKLVVHLLTDCTVVAFSTDAHQPSFSHLWWHAWRSTGVIFLLYCMSKPQPPHPCDTGYVCPALSISCTDNHFQNIGYHVCPVLSIPCAENHYKTLGICPALSISCTNNHFQNNDHVCPLLSIPGADNHFQNRYSSMPQCQAIQHRLS